MNRVFLTRIINDRGMSYSFIATMIGGVFLILSGLISDPNIGRAITGALITLRGGVSESCRHILRKKGYQEATSALPGMSIAAFMNWPAFFSAKTIYEAIAYALPAFAMSLKFIQYLPTTLGEVFGNNKFIIKAATWIARINARCLNKINKYAGLNILLSAPFFLFDVWIRQDLFGLFAGTFLILGGVLLAAKTWLELSEN